MSIFSHVALIVLTNLFVFFVGWSQAMLLGRAKLARRNAEIDELEEQKELLIASESKYSKKAEQYAKKVEQKEYRCQQLEKACEIRRQQSKASKEYAVKIQRMLDDEIAKSAALRVAMSRLMQSGCECDESDR